LERIGGELLERELTAYESPESTNNEPLYEDSVQLATAAIRGDEEAFLRRIESEREKLYAIAYSYMRHQVNALEAVQETVCRAWLKRKTLREPQYWSTWLVRILIHVCMDMQRKQKRELLLDHTVIDAVEKRADDLAEMLARRMEIEAALDRLDAKERMVIVLKYYRDMTLSEVALLMDKPLGTVKTWLNKALVKLRTALGQREGDE
jgi:RNA polymerase sigma-70 factor (ECF subfamily)